MEIQIDEVGIKLGREADISQSVGWNLLRWVFVRYGL